MSNKPTTATQVHRITLPLTVKTKKMPNKNHPIAYRVEDADGNPLVAHSGLFGWGWCSSRDGALLHAGVSESQVSR